MPAGIVHALAEAWRVLRAGGHLIDLRPIASPCPVEVMTDTEISLAGWLDTTPKIPSDEASDKAITEAVERGLFIEEKVTTFQFAFYWQTIEEMQTYLKVNWPDSAILPNLVQAEADRLIQRATRPAQIRVQRRMHLARYRKLGVGPNDANTVRVRAASGTASISSNAVSAWEK